jgi:hypothetical protein
VKDKIIMDPRKMLRGKNELSPVLVPVPVPEQPMELGTIDYRNLTADGEHGDFDVAVQAAAETGKPIFANFVMWAG